MPDEAPTVAVHPPTIDRDAIACAKAKAQAQAQAEAEKLRLTLGERRGGRSEGKGEGGEKYEKYGNEPAAKLARKERDGEGVRGPLEEFRKSLPAFEFRRKFLKTVKKNQVTIVIGETGSGKTTQCPQFLLEKDLHAGGCIAVTQPRRVAAMSVAKRVAEERGVELGREVGYKVRFDARVTAGAKSGNTVLKFCTDGALLREAQTNPTFEGYSVIILDEAHERTTDTDILMGLLKSLLKEGKRADLKIIIMSATINAKAFQNYFNGAPLIEIHGRTHPVEILYSSQPEKSYFDAALATAMRIHAQEPSGDILIFLTGEEEVDNMCASLKADAKALSEKNPAIPHLVVLPLYSSLPPAQQQLVFDSVNPQPHTNSHINSHINSHTNLHTNSHTHSSTTDATTTRYRKCVVSTNIAETSITIDGIVFVIDPGLSKQKVFNPRNRVESLLVAPISKASANQRAGRAGRTAPGKCFRMYTEDSFKALQEQTYPEILRSNLSAVVLALMRLGQTDLVHFDFMEAPAPETMMRALEELNFLTALSNEGELTPLGGLMSEFPLDPLIAKLVLVASRFQLEGEALSLAAILSSAPLFQRPREQAKAADDAKKAFADETSDHITLLNAFEQFEKTPAAEQSQFCWNNFLNLRSLSAASKIRAQISKLYDKLQPALKKIESEASGRASGLCRGVGEGVEMSRSRQIRRMIAHAFFLQAARLNKDLALTQELTGGGKKGGAKKGGGKNGGARRGAYNYETLPDLHPCAVHPSSVVRHEAPWLIFNEYSMTSRNYLRLVTVIEPEWLVEASATFWNPKRLPMNSQARKDIERASAKLR